ncbi:MAG: hypothetical protein ABJA66_01660 [Actinomycetota bacterium]
MKRIFSLFALVTLFSIAAFADIRLPDTPKPTPSPKQKKSVESNLMIRLDKNVNEAKLIIPKSELKQLRAALEDLDGDTGNTAMNITKTQTIVSGLFLSLAMVFGGVWFARSRRTGGKMNKTAAVGAVLFLIGSAATIAFANMGPPPELRSISSKLFNKQTFSGWNSASGKVKIEVSENDASMIELVVPDKAEPKADE